MTGVMMRSILRSTARLPLFDRLIDENPEEKEETVILDRLDIEGLKFSIQKELRMILNTRSTVKAKNRKEEILYRSPEAFGLKEYTHLRPTGGDGKSLIKSFVQAITMYEPRLLKPHVRIVGYEKNSQKLFIEVQGMIRLGERLERFAFPLDLQSE